MKNRFKLYLLLLIVTAGCQNQSEEKKTPEKKDYISKEIRTGGYRLTMQLPSSPVVKGAYDVSFNEERGELNIKNGAEFGLIIYEDESQLEATKNQINQHPYYSVEVVEESDSTLLYRFYVDGSPKDLWHFYAERKIGQPLTLFKSNDQMEFTEFYARKMLASALTTEQLP